MQVVKGNPTPEELAAVIAVVASRTSRDRPGPGAAARPPAGVWGERARNIRRMPPPGPGAWRSSAWPR